MVARFSQILPEKVSALRACMHKYLYAVRVWTQTNSEAQKSLRHAVCVDPRLGTPRMGWSEGLGVYSVVKPSIQTPITSCSRARPLISTACASGIWKQDALSFRKSRVTEFKLQLLLQGRELQARARKRQIIRHKRWRRKSLLPIVQFKLLHLSPRKPKARKSWE